MSLALTEEALAHNISTVRGSGWVAVRNAKIAIDYGHGSLHPSATADAVLTVSKYDVMTFKEEVCYSLRKATSGSNFDARRAGM